MGYFPMTFNDQETVAAVHEFLKKPEQSELSKKIERLEAVEDLCGQILATLLLEQNKEAVHPELLVFAKSWKERYDRNR